MKHLKKFNESKEVELTEEELKVISNLEKLSKADDVSKTQKTLISKVISEIKSGKYK
jgi:hypothetical protein